MKPFKVFWATAVLMFLSSPAWADVPRLINFQGVLRDANDSLVPNSSYTVFFKIYDAPTSGNELWAETLTVNTTRGLFTALLGSSNPLPDSVFNDTLRWLGIRIDPDLIEMAPRQRLVSVGYSFAFAGFNIQDSNVILADRLGGSVGIGTNNPTEKLDVAGNIKSSDTIFASAFSSNSPLKLQTNKTTRIYVDDVTGHVGIGTTSPNVGGLDGVNNRILTIRAPGTLGAGILELVGERTTDLDVGELVFSNATSASQIARITGRRSGANNSGILTFYTLSAGSESERMRITSSGNVGIGTMSPATKLHVQSTADEVLRLTSSSNGLRLGADVNGAFLEPTSSNFRINANSSTTTIFVNGLSSNVGIGTMSPSEKFDVAGNANFSGLYPYISLATSSWPSAALMQAGINLAGSASGDYLMVHTPNAKGFTFHQGTTNRLTIDPSGNVGIGTTTPQGVLDVSSTTGAFIVPRMTTSQRDALTAINGMIIYNTTDNQFNFYENGAWVTK